MREPAFWWREAGLAAGLLTPVAAAFGWAAAARLAERGARLPVPVICVGNPTLGGAGKTPLALTLASRLAAAGDAPALLSRGYGGRLAGPLRVDPARHRAFDVGDEPLLLAQAAPTFVARDRFKGAQAAIAAGARVVVMDDGFQNPSLQKDFSVLVVDARRGIGNGCVFPAGPLRAPLGPQLARADALVVVGEENGADRVATAARKHGLPVFRAQLMADAAAVAALAGSRVLAFAGIGDPGKLFATLNRAGVTVAATRWFADHHPYTRKEADMLCEEAERESLALVTTQKDLVRIQSDPSLAGLAARARALPVTLVFSDEDAFLRVMRAKLQHVTG
ncbi:MAG TPA: tetraacyldisaccharide 4'-kinase [Xanthobacteraceae bacterium]|nr:tetraacyldisaccharide 4'-kinase [Xanthobacteraceae bacterium]